MKKVKTFAEEMEASLVRAIKELMEDNPYDNPHSPESKASDAIRAKTTQAYQKDVHKRGWDHPDYVALVKKRAETKARLQAAKPKVAPKHDTSKALPSGFHGFDEENSGATANRFGNHPGDRNPGYADRKSDAALEASRTAFKTGQRGVPKGPSYAEDHKWAAKAHREAAEAHHAASKVGLETMGRYPGYHSDYERDHTERAKRHTQLANE